ncbi:hypothetical protein BDR05DRAFT_1002869 [Suillus weaverae]|nr:hypothetical protein BDR05DRAFT_1002869 [Suillus weaverae]
MSKNLSSHVNELLWNSSPFQLSSERKSDHKLLHKAKMRLWNMWQDVQLTSSGIDVKETAISEIELSRAAVSIAYAAVNSHKLLFEFDQDKAKVSPNLLNADGQQRETLAKYFKTPFGHSSEPTMFIDKHGRILAWHLPEILVPDRMEHINSSVKSLRPILDKSLPKATKEEKCPWRSQGFVIPSGGGEFGAGQVTLCPGGFMQCQECLQDCLCQSTSLSSPVVCDWLATMTVTEQFWLAITSIISPDRYLASVKSTSTLKDIVHTPNPVVWPSMFSGIKVIVNRETPHHRDPGASPSVYDLLVSLGQDHQAV